MTSLYRLRPDSEGIVVQYVDAESPLDSWRGIPGKQRDDLFSGVQTVSPDQLFTLALQIVTAGEPRQLRVIKRLAALRSRNIKLGVLTTSGYHAIALGLIIRKTDKKKLKKLSKEEREIIIAAEEEKQRRNKMEIDRLDTLVRSALEPVRAELGWSEVAPVDRCYTIDESVIAAAKTEACKQFLERTVTTIGTLYPADLKKVSDELKSKYPDEAEVVLDVLKGTKTREHLAAISLTSIEDQLTVELANVHGQSVRMEAWKFVRLLESSGVGQRLGTINKQTYRDSDVPLRFNDCRGVDIFACFDAKISTLNVVGQAEDAKGPGDRSLFVIDLDYALCLYVMLKRLREDKERFERLKESADTTVDQNIFERLYS